MENVTFALPTLGSTAMSPNDQTAVLVNQATAVIVSAWLAHQNVVLETGQRLSTGTSQEDTERFEATISEAELSSVINSVQNALRSG